MIKQQSLIEQTLTMLESHHVGVDDGVLEALTSSLGNEVAQQENSPETVLCEVSLSTSQLEHLISVLFDLEADLAPKGMGYGSAEDLHKERSAKMVATIVDRWNTP